MADAGLAIEGAGVVAVGHRVVHGGREFSAPVLVDDHVLAEIERLGSLAPLHNPANALGIEAARRIFPDLPQVAVFDTGFFATLPAAASTYAIDAGVAREHAIRRYGFHGTSHEYVSARVAEFLAPGNVATVTGAGVSVDSGIRAYRGSKGIYLNPNYK